MTPGRTFIELFCGGGMARHGLGDGWRCLLANDVDPAKAAAYRANWGSAGLLVQDVRELRSASIVERPDLLWASSPCQDLSLAGSRGGLDGGRSGALWPALDFVRQLNDRGFGPRTIVIENVTGMITSENGRDLQAVASTLAKAGYRVGGLVADARLYLPQSRKRLFIVAVAADVAIPAHLLSPGPASPGHPASLARLVPTLPGWLWWVLPVPPRRTTELTDILEPPGTVTWHDRATMEYWLAMMPPGSIERLRLAGHRGEAAAVLNRRTRPNGTGGGQPRVELRMDGVACCLRTAGGGSSQQVLVVAEGGGIRTRHLTPREAARLMGLPDTYKLPRKREAALSLLGDGLAVPVVRHLAASILEPVLDHRDEKPAAVARKGIKGATRATTVYFLPHELRRLRGLAVQLDVSLHDLLLRGLDRILAEQGQRPLERYG